MLNSKCNTTHNLLILFTKNTILMEMEDLICKNGINSVKIFTIMSSRKIKKNNFDTLKWFIVHIYLQFFILSINIQPFYQNRNYNKILKCRTQTASHLWAIPLTCTIKITVTTIPWELKILNNKIKIISNN